MKRYEVLGVADGLPDIKYVIYDKTLQANCALPYGSTLIPLEWRNKTNAEAWLQRCYKVWDQWEEAGADVPVGWEPSVPLKSPFTNRRYPAEYNDAWSLRSTFVERRPL